MISFVRTVPILMKLSIIIPIFNEKETIDELYKRLIESLKKDFSKNTYEIIFVDDGSNDNSFELLRKLRRKNKKIKLIQFSRNFGHHIAITAGIDYATGDYIVMMDGDLQDRPEEIITLYKKIKEGYDVVYANRIDKKFGLLKKANSWLFNFVIKILVDENIPINSTIFRMMSKKVAENLKSIRESNRYLIGLIGWVGFNQTSVDVKHGKRFAGKTKYSISKQMDLALNAVFSFSNYPLRIAIRIGSLFILLSIFLVVFALVRKLVFGTAFVGWTSLLISILAVGGIQIILLGVIGEYIGRSYIENKKRPLYIVKELIK